MSNSVLITLIICITVIAVVAISAARDLKGGKK